MSKKDSDVFSVEKLRELLELMKEFDLTEIDLVQSDQEIRFARGGGQAPVMMAQPVAAQPVPAAAAAESPKAADGPHIKTISAPMVGTFYSKPKPESEDFVKIGSRISADTVICIVEAMKVFNEIPAEISGTVVEILARNEDTVDFGRPLFKVDTRG